MEPLSLKVVRRAAAELVQAAQAPAACNVHTAYEIQKLHGFVTATIEKFPANAVFGKIRVAKSFRVPKRGEDLLTALRPLSILFVCVPDSDLNSTL